MPVKEGLPKSILGMGLLGASLILSGCSRKEPIEVKQALKSNNLKYVECKKHDANYPGFTEIIVNATNGIADEDQVIFVCKGEKLRWTAGNGVQEFHVTFANTEWPFEGQAQNDLAGGANNSTQDQEISSKVVLYHPYKYKIHVMASGKMIDLDPHVIPM